MLDTSHVMIRSDRPISKQGHSRLLIIFLCIALQYAVCRHAGVQRMRVDVETNSRGLTSDPDRPTQARFSNLRFHPLLGTTSFKERQPWERMYMLVISFFAACCTVFCVQKYWIFSLAKGGFVPRDSNSDYK